MAGSARPSADRLESRLEFETLIADTSASLFAAPPDQLDLAVEGALERVRKFFQADRCAIPRARIRPSPSRPATCRDRRPSPGSGR